MVERPVAGALDGDDRQDVTLSVSPANRNDARKLTIPAGTEWMTLAGAAQAYVAAGWYVLPIGDGDAKHAGSLLGTGWPEKSSRDPELIARWFGHHRAKGLALHPRLRSVDLERHAQWDRVPSHQRLPAGIRRRCARRRGPADRRRQTTRPRTGRRTAQLALRCAATRTQQPNARQRGATPTTSQAPSATTHNNERGPNTPQSSGSETSPSTHLFTPIGVEHPLKRGTSQLPARAWVARVPRLMRGCENRLAEVIGAAGDTEHYL